MASTTKLYYKDGTTNVVPTADLAYWKGQGWTDVAPTATQSAPTGQAPSQDMATQTPVTATASASSTQQMATPVSLGTKLTPSQYSAFVAKNKVGASTFDKYFNKQGTDIYLKQGFNLEPAPNEINAGAGAKGTLPGQGYTGSTFEELYGKTNAFQQGIASELATMQADLDKRQKEAQTQYDTAAQSLKDMGTFDPQAIYDTFAKQNQLKEKYDNLTTASNDLITLNTELQQEVQAVRSKPLLGSVLRGQELLKLQEYQPLITAAQARVDLYKGQTDAAEKKFTQFYAWQKDIRDEEIGRYEKLMDLANNKVISLDNAERDVIKTKIEQLQALSTQAEQNKVNLANLMLEHPTAFANAKITPNDDYATATKKMAPYIQQETTKTQVMAIAAKYPDAGILPTDSVATATAKLKNSDIYKKDTFISEKWTPLQDSNGNIIGLFDRNTGELNQPVMMPPVGSKVNTELGGGTVTSYGSFADAKLPENQRGLDIVFNDPNIKIPEGFKVEYAKKDGNYGNSIKLTTDSGQTIILSHFDSMNVKPGQHYDAGTVIGVQGSTGMSTGKHVDIRVPGRTPKEIAQLMGIGVSINSNNGNNPLNTLVQKAAASAKEVESRLGYNADPNSPSGKAFWQIVDQAAQSAGMTKDTMGALIISEMSKGVTPSSPAPQPATPGSSYTPPTSNIYGKGNFANVDVQTRVRQLTESYKNLQGNELVNQIRDSLRKNGYPENEVQKIKYVGAMGAVQSVLSAFGIK